MDFFAYRNGKLFAENVDVAEVAAVAGTPVYIYSKATIKHHIKRLQDAFAPLEPLICYSVKANSNLSILAVAAKAGTGFDIVSGGELFRVAAAGTKAGKVVYSGVGKTADEIAYALKLGILMFNAESEAELHEIDHMAASLGKRARVAMRLNPDVDAHTHEYITTARKFNKFGITLDEAEGIARRWKEFPNCDMVGVDMHIGSQITEPEAYGVAIDRVMAFKDKLVSMGHRIEYFDIGGGFGIFYRGGEARDASDFAAVIVPRLRGKGMKVIMEPGRFIVGNAGVLIMRVVYVKEQGGKRFVICDAGMNDLVRPAFYGSYHKIWPAHTSAPFTPEVSPETPPADIVGPICESGDFFAKDYPLPPVKQGQYLAIFSAGAYGMAMASNYNSRPRAAEVMVDDTNWNVIRRRETYEDIIDAEIEGLE